MTTPLHLVLLAGGRGLRAAGADSLPKQFRVTGRGPLFAVSLREFLRPVAAASWHLASVTVTVDTPWRERVAAELESCPCPWQMASPGVTRTASTWSAVQALRAASAPPVDTDLVAVHDAARPFASSALLNALAEAALVTGGAIPGIPVADTVVETSDGAARYLDRRSLLAVQTPQVFRWEHFHLAHAWAHQTGVDFTDDGGLLAARGHEPAVVAGEATNWKVTTAADWERARELLR